MKKKNCPVHKQQDRDHISGDFVAKSKAKNISVTKNQKLIIDKLDLVLKGIAQLNERFTKNNLYFSKYLKFNEDEKVRRRESPR